MEWLAYHRAIGFTDFLIYTNDCSDGTDLLLDRLQHNGIVTHVRNKVLKRGPHLSALKYAKDHSLYSGADWAYVCDVYEFLNIKIGNGHVEDLIAHFADADAIPVAWRLFSNNGHLAQFPGLCTEVFTDAQPQNAQSGEKGRFVKSLFQPSPHVQRLGLHGPLYKKSHAAEKKWGAVWQLNHDFDRAPTKPLKDFGYEIAEVNHYAVRSIDAFLLKRDRGRANHVGETLGAEYWKRWCMGGECDTSIQRHAEAMKNEYDQLYTDPVVAHLHQAALEYQQQRLKSLRKIDAFESLRNELIDLSGLESDRSFPDEVFQKEKTDQRNSDPTVHITSIGKDFNERPAGTTKKNQDLLWDNIAKELAGKEGFYKAGPEGHSFVYTPRSKNTLVVTFDNLDIAMTKRDDRRPWGFSFIEAQGWSMLGVLAGGWTWYRNNWVSEQFDELRENGFFEKFDRVVLYGASMGGYAACVFCAAIPNSEVVAISPQTTLDKSVVPWETRYKTAWHRDYTGKYGDASDTISAAKKAYIIYDPYEPLDTKHVKRLSGENIVTLRAPLLGHRLGSSLSQMGILSPIVLGALKGTLTPNDYYKLLRTRRSFPRFQRELFQRALKKGHRELAFKLGNYVLKKNSNRGIEKEMKMLTLEIEPGKLTADHEPKIIEKGDIVAKMVQANGQKMKAPKRLALRRKMLDELMPKGGRGAEIGVWEGDFSAEILNITSPSELVLIDPWDLLAAKKEEHTHSQHASDELMRQKYEEIVNGIGKLDNCTIRKGFSAEVMETYPDNYFDWAYIDGNHLYDFVLKDILVCARKVKSGGLIAGDDFWWKRNNRSHVREAVFEAIKQLYLRSAL